MSRPVSIVCPHCDSVNGLPPARLAQHPYCGRCADDLFAGRPADLSAGNFDLHISVSDIPVAVQLWAPWCNTCRAIAHAYERAAVALEPEIRIARLNIDSAPQIAGRLQVNSVPTLLVFRHGIECGRRSGLIPLLELMGWIGDQCRPAAGCAEAPNLRVFTPISLQQPRNSRAEKNPEACSGHQRDP